MLFSSVFLICNKAGFQLGNVTFCKVGNAFSKHCKFPCRRSGKTAFPKNYVPFSLGFMLFSSAFSDFQKSLALGLQLNVTKVGNRVQQTMQIQTEMMCYFTENVKLHVVFVYIYMVCWTRFQLCKRLAFPIGKFNILQSVKRVQQTMQIQTEFMCYFTENVKRHAFFVCIYLVCWTRFPLCKKLTFPFGKLNDLQSLKRVQQTR